MKLSVLGSSSKGNCYILENRDEALIIEVGISIKDLKKSLNFNISKVVGCLVTHQHNDHSKYIKNIVEMGIYTLALKEVWESKQINSPYAINITMGKGYKFGNFKVIPFNACHDVACVGYIVDHSEIGRLFFLTDSYMCEYKIPKMNHILIECNYSDKELSKAIFEGRTLPSQKERLLTSHMELSNCINMLNANDLNNVSEIMLIHLSENNSNENYFLSEVERATGKIVYIANPGLTIEL